MEEKRKPKDFVVWVMFIMIAFAAIAIAFVKNLLDNQDKITTEYIQAQQEIEQNSK
jgi:hypothetical protein